MAAHIKRPCWRGSPRRDSTAPLPYNAPHNSSVGMPIRGFACTETERLFQTGKSRRFANILAVAVRKLDMLNACVTLADLQIPPGNQLEALKGDWIGRHRIRINRQWRLCFMWTKAGPDRVGIVDYH